MYGLSTPMGFLIRGVHSLVFLLVVLVVEEATAHHHVPKLKLQALNNKP